jgi:F-type H+-transporting ATPase subunit b
MNISIIDIAIAIFNFLLLLILLWLVLYRPVIRMLDEREGRIRHENEEIERMKNEATQLRQEWEEKNAEISSQAHQIIEEATKQAQKAREDILAQAREDARRILARAENEVVRERTRAWEELWGDMVNLVITAATKIVGEDFDDTKHRKRIQNFISNIDSRRIGELTNEQGT